jgi:hypothetical protein
VRPRLVLTVAYVLRRRPRRYSSATVLRQASRSSRDRSEAT